MCQKGLSSRAFLPFPRKNNEVKKKIFALLILVAAGFRLEAQSLLLQHFGVREGLANSTVYHAWQDAEGFLWFGTESGLCRYDGSRFQTFTTADGLPSNCVLRVEGDRDGRMWLSCFNKNPTIFRLNGAAALPDSAMQTLRFTAGNNAFFRADSALFLFRENEAYKVSGRSVEPLTVTARTHPGHPKIGRLPAVIAMTKAHGRVFFASEKAVFELLGDGSARFVFSLEREIGHYERIAAFGPFVFFIDGEKLVLLEILPNSTARRVGEAEFGTAIERVTVEKNGRLWATTHEKGIVRLDYGPSGFGRRFEIPQVKTLASVFTDREGVTWFSTLDDGVFAMADENRFVVSERDGMPFSKIFSLEKGASGGDVLAGDARGRLVFLKNGRPGKSLRVGVRFDNRLLSVQRHGPSKKVWIASDEGVFIGDGKGEIRRLPKITASKRLFLGKKSIWTASSIRINEYDFSENAISVHSFPSRAMAVCEASNGAIWVGLLDGLAVLGPEKGDSVRLEKNWPELLGGRITAIAEGAEGRIFVATHQKGIVAFDSERRLVRHLTVADGLTSDICQNIRTDARGFVWVSTNAGLCKIDPKTFEITRFSTANTLPDDDVNDALAVGDTVWAATAGGIACFLDKPSQPFSDFRTAVTELLADGKPLVFQAGERLVFDEGVYLEAHFAGLSTRSGGRFSYRFRIFEKMPPLGSATFENLWAALFGLFKKGPRLVEVRDGGPFFPQNNAKAGLFRLEAAAIGYDGGMSARPAELEFLIRPRIVRRAWFQFLAMLVLAAGAWRFYRWRVAEHDRQSRLREQMTSLQLEAFKAQINPHFIFNTINGVQRFFFPPDPVAANEYIALFSSLLRKTLDFSEKTTVPFAVEVEFLREFLDLTRLRVGEKFRYEIVGAEAVAPDSEMPSMLLQPLVENAIVHGFPPSGQAVLRLIFEKKGERLHCFVEDNGLGVRASLRRRHESGDNRTPHGTQMVRQRVEALNELTGREIRLDVRDKMDLAEAVGTGTVAEVSFKIIEPKK